MDFMECSVLIARGWLQGIRKAALYFTRVSALCLILKASKAAEKLEPQATLNTHKSLLYNCPGPQGPVHCGLDLSVTHTFNRASHVPSYAARSSKWAERESKWFASQCQSCSRFRVIKSIE